MGSKKHPLARDRAVAPMDGVDAKLLELLAVDARASLRTLGAEEISIVTGATDVLIRARVADPAYLRYFLVEHIWSLRGIQRVKTTLAVEAARVAWFIEALLERWIARPLTGS